MSGSNYGELPANFQPERIGIIKPSALGDVVQTLPLLSAFRARFPKAEVSWVINAELVDLLRGHPEIDELIPFERRGGWGEWWRLLQRLRASRFDLVFDLQGLLRTAVMTRATGAAVRIGLETAREGSHLAVHDLVPETDRFVPAHARYWRVAEWLGMGEVGREARLPIDKEADLWAEDMVGPLPGPLLAVNPGAKWITKRWPPERFASTAAKAMRKFGFSTVVLGGPGDRERSMQVTRLLRDFVPSGQVANLCGRTNLRQLTAVLRRIDLMLTNDSGPMHLAAALGKPVVGVFTCTSAVRSGPPGAQHRLVATELPCAASYRKECPFRGAGHLACLDELSGERVWRAMQELLAPQPLRIAA